MYNFKKVEKKWQKYWEDNETFKTDVYDFSKPKYYALDMFPYPSGVGLHAGHPEGYTATDIVSRMKRMQGYNVLHPMGWDAFGLPAEQYAIKTGNHPNGFTEKNIATFKGQLKSLGFSYDWNRELSTTDPKYYKWTQWIFKRLYEDGLAQNVNMPVNWCEGLGTVLSNDEVIDGKSERGGFPVVRREMKQWSMDIPKYAEKLLNGLDELDWPESTKEIQRNWIGKSVGAEVNFKVDNTDYEFTVFTTRCDTLYGVTYCVLSPEHSLVDKITTSDKAKEVDEYKKICASKSDLERTELSKEKTGVFTGSYAINPLSGEKIPIWISDYVLSSYGTGAIMAVPAHDERDYEFAQKFNLEIKPVIAKVYVDKTHPHQSGKDLVINENVVIVCKHPKENKYITVTYNGFGWNTFPMGAVEEGETYLEAATRELREETGYTSFDVDKISRFKFIDKFYAAHKGVNKVTTSTICFGKLKDLSQDKISEEEKSIQSYKWVSLDELEEYLNIESHNNIVSSIKNGETAYTGDGVHINSNILDGLGKNEAIEKMLDYLEENGYGKRKINYRLRKWIFARQRYWGEPVPIVYLDNGKTICLKDNELPLELPVLKDYESHGGTSPLDNAESWKRVTVDGVQGTRETATMPGSAGSSWYFLRYIDPDNDKKIADKKLLDHWMPVDLYVGGPEHAVGHLLYSRFWNNYLYDKGLLSCPEPFKKLRHQGMILGSNGLKMGKRFPEFVVNPTDIVESHGADALRLYEMFMGPIEADKPWSDEGLDGAKKFIDRVYRLIIESGKVIDKGNKSLERLFHYTVKKVTDDYESLNFNTAISQLMIFVNECYKEDVVPLAYIKDFIKLLNPVAPHITEELWEMLGGETTIAYESWPIYDDDKITLDMISIGVQINGKLRGTINVNASSSAKELEEVALRDEKISKYVQDKDIIKIIAIPNKIVNIVLK